MNNNFPPCLLPPYSSVVIYLRDSGGENQQELATSSQKAYMVAYCQFHKLKIEAFFEDGAVSGRSTKGRNEFERMIDYLMHYKKPIVDGVLYYDISRFGRNTQDSRYYKTILRRKGYIVFSAVDNIPEGPMGDVFEVFFESVSQLESERIARNVKRGLDDMTAMRGSDGKYLGLAPGIPPKCFMGESYDLGTFKNNGRPRIVQRWVPDPKLWDKGIMAWEMRAKGRSYGAINIACGLFNALNSYNTFFRNPIYIGNYYRSGTLYEDFVPAMVDKAIWEAAQVYNFPQVKKGQSFPVLHPKSGHGSYVLSGLCECEFCHGKMHGDSIEDRHDASHKFRYYRCAKKSKCPNHKIRADELEISVVNTVLDILLSDDFVFGLIGQIESKISNITEIERKVKYLKSDLIALNKAIEKIMDMVEVHGATPWLRKRLTEREQESAGIEAELKSLTSMLDRTQLKISPPVIKYLIQEMKTSLNQEDVEQKRSILKQTIQKITVSPNSAKLFYTFPLERLGFYSVPSGRLELNPQPFIEIFYRDIQYA